jgi:DNA-binding transcriptional MocR family regulator
LRTRGRIVGNRRAGSTVIGRVRFQCASPVAAPPGTRSLLEANPDPAFLPALRPIIGGAVIEGRLYGDLRESADLIRVARRRLSADGVPAQHLAIVCGAMDGVERALGSHLAAGDTIGLEDPAYPPYIELARALQLRVVRMPVDDYGVTEAGVREAIRAGSRALVVVPRAHNPCGVSFNASRARAIGALLRAASNVLAVEDDYLSEIAGVPLHSLTRAAPRFAYVRSYAKLLGPDLRVAILAGDELTVGRIRDRQRLGCGWISHILQNAVATLLDDPATERLFKRAERAYAKRRRAFVDALARYGLGACGETGLVVWVRVPDEASAVAHAASSGWAIDAGARYRSEGLPGVRVAIARLDPSDADAVAGAIAGACAPVERTSSG